MPSLPLEYALWKASWIRIPNIMYADTHHCERLILLDIESTAQPLCSVLQITCVVIHRIVIHSIGFVFVFLAHRGLGLYYFICTSTVLTVLSAVHQTARWGGFE